MRPRRKLTFAIAKTISSPQRITERLCTHKIWEHASKNRLPKQERNDWQSRRVGTKRFFHNGLDTRLHRSRGNWRINRSQNPIHQQQGTTRWFSQKNFREFRMEKPTHTRPLRENSSSSQHFHCYYYRVIESNTFLCLSLTFSWMGTSTPCVNARDSERGTAWAVVLEKNRTKIIYCRTLANLKDMAKKNVSRILSFSWWE